MACNTRGTECGAVLRSLETFTFFGFTSHLRLLPAEGCFSSYNAGTRRDRMRAKLRDAEVPPALKPCECTEPWIPQQCLRLLGFDAGVLCGTTPSRPITASREADHHLRARSLAARSLRRRSQKDWTTWERISRLAPGFTCPRLASFHPWPSIRFAVNHPRWEPGARIAPAGICAGGAR